MLGQNVAVLVQHLLHNVGLIEIAAVDAGRLSRHGQQTLIEAVGHSCNPAFISMGLSVGTETYYKYLKSFGLMDKTGMTAKEMDTYMNKKSGMLGITGISSDMREIDAACEEGNERALLATDMYFYRIRKYIGAYAAAMDGCDIIVFTAGVGENQASMREKVCEGLSFMGVKVDVEKISMIRWLSVSLRISMIRWIIWIKETRNPRNPETHPGPPKGREGDTQ